MPRSLVGKYLAAHGPSLSSDLVRDFGAAGTRSDTVRKRIERARGSSEVRSLFALRLPHGDSFLYLKEQFGTEAYWSGLLSALVRSRSAYGMLVQAMIARGGAVALDEVAIVSGAPVAMDKQLTTDHVVEGLLEVGLIEQAPSGDALVLRGDGPWPWTDGRNIVPRRLAENVLRGAVGAWASRLGMVSPGQLDTGQNGTLPMFGQFAWHVVGPCYLNPLAEPGTDRVKPGFYVADVHLGGMLTKEQVQPFVTKCRRMRAQPTQRPFLAMLVADWFEEDALSYGRAQGLMFVTPRDLFGEAAAEALRQLLRSLTNAAAVAAEKPEVIGELFDALGKIEGAASNLRGPLFELIAAHCLHSLEGVHITWGTKIRDPKTGEKAEIDVLGVRPDQRVWLIECKGKQPGGRATLEEVQDWMKRQVPRMNRWLDGSRDRSSARSFAFWTTGSIDDDAVEYLKARKAATKKYEIDWKDGEDVKALARKVASPSVRETLSEHYLAHPLSDVLPAEPNSDLVETEEGAVADLPF